MGRLTGKVALVTGAGQGIGRSIAEVFAREDSQVFAIDKQWLEVPASERIESIGVDATDVNAIAQIVARSPTFDILVNCVGWVATGTVLDTSAEELQRSFDLNVVTMVNTISSVLPRMIEKGTGSIINIASVVSSTKGVPDRFAYATTKAAVIGLTKSVARDFIAKGIRCNCISPGSTASPSLDARFAATGDAEAARAAFVMRQPLGRLGKPNEIAEVALLLATDEAQFMTGTDVVIDGGMSL